jgi:hypothetical protein
MVTTTNTGGIRFTNTIDMSRVSTACPILLAVYREVLRFYSGAVSARMEHINLVAHMRRELVR